MAKLKATFDLTDGWRKSNPRARSFSWEGSSGSDRRKIFSRIDRIYATKKTWEITNEYRITNCDISDHDGVSVTVRDASAPDTGKGEQKLNLNILNHPIFRKQADKLLDKLERQLNRYEKLESTKHRKHEEASICKLREHFNPQKLWNNYKEGILTASAQATQSRRKEITKLRRGAEREIKRAERQLRDCEPGKEEEYRRILSD